MVETALQDLHQGIAYALLLAALATLSVAVARKPGDASAIRTLRTILRVAVLGIGRLFVALGLVLAAMEPSSEGLPWAVAAVLAWVPVEITWRRWLLPELELAELGARTTRRLEGGLAIHAILVGMLFALSTITPGAQS